MTAQPLGRATGGADEKVIRVVDAKRALADITLLSAEELQTILETLVQEFDPGERQALLALERIAADLQRLRDRDPAGGDFIFAGPQSRGGAGAPSMPEVVLRQLLYSPAVVPAVAGYAEKISNKDVSSKRDVGSNKDGIRVRAGVRKPALIRNTSAVAEERRLRPYLDVAIAAEQPAVVEGLALDPARQGDLLVDVFAGGVFPGYRALANSGLYSAPVLSAALARDQVARGDVHPYSAEYAEELRTQLGFSLAYHLSGAAVFVALAETLRRVAGAPVADISGEIVRTPARGVETDSAPVLASFVTQLAEVFGSVTAVPEEFIFALTPLLDVFRVGALGAYYSALTGGPGAQRFLERAAIVHAEEAQLAALDRAVFGDIARARHYAIVIEDKLGAAKLREVEEKLASAGRAETAGPDDPEAILAVLSKREREIVSTEYVNRRAEWEAQVDNKCPHVRLAFRLRAVRSARDATRILRELEAYYARPRGSAPGKDQWILCKNCGFRVICPHVDELIKMEARNLPYDTIRTRLMKYAVQYSDGAARTTYSYFCRICSEQLAEFVEEDRTAEVLGAVGDLDDYVKKIIWIEAVNAAELVRFPMPIDPRQFASTAIDVCYPLLLIAEANMLKRGRRAAAKSPGPADPYGDEETVDPRTHLYIALFVYAYVLNLIRSSHEASKAPSRRLSFEGVRIDAKMSTYAEAILSAILKKYAGVISQIEDITPEFIADRFREAYRLVAGEAGPQELTAADEGKIIVNEVVTLSPAYHYIAMAARVFGVLPVARPETPESARREFETVLGRTLPAILEDRATDSKSELVQMLLGVRPTNRGTRRVAVEYPRGADPLYIYGVPEVNFLEKIMRAPKAFVKSVDPAPLEKLSALAKAMPACPQHCVVEAVGGKAAPRKPAAKKPAAKKPAAKKASKKPAAEKTAKKTGKKAVSFIKKAFLRADPLCAPAESALYLEAFRLFTEYTTGVVDARSMAEYEARLSAARLRERGYLIYRAATAVKNYRQFGFTASRRFGRHRDPRPADRRKNRLPGDAPAVPLTYLYDENGLRHSWAGPRAGGGNIYVYSTGAKKGAPIELGVKDLEKNIAEAYARGDHEGPIYGRTLVDVKCSVCGVLLSEIHTLDPLKAEDSLRAIAEFDTFFSFYSSRCPVGDLHDFGEEAACVKCGIAEALIFGHGLPKNAPAARAYYDKFLERYREQRNVAVSLSAFAETSRVSADSFEAYREFAEKWQPDYTYLVRAAELADVPVAALETLGATGGREYPDVLSGAGAPPPPESPDDPRLLAVDSDVRVFTTDYNRLRFVHRFAKVPPEVEALLEDMKVPRHEFEGLAAKLPDVYENYHLKRIALLRYRSPEDVLQFGIETLARMALAVANVAPGASEWLRALGQEFARRELAAIVRSERLLAKNGPFNFKIFGDEDIGGGSLGGIDEPADDFGSPGEDVLAEIEEAGGEDGAYDPFSLEGADIDEDSPNLEPE